MNAGHHRIQKVLAFSFAPLLLSSPIYATCGGGGGGGMGGISSGAAATVYYVPWVFVETPQQAPLGDLLVYWFPTGPENAQGSSMRTSRNLLTWSGGCVGVGLVPDTNSELRSRFMIEPNQATAVVATQQGDEIARIGSAGDKLSVRDVEKAVSAELKERESTHKLAMKSAKRAQKGGDDDGAAVLYLEVAHDGCLFPALGRKAAKALRKMGRSAPEIAAAGDYPEPDLDPGTTDQITALMQTGLAAEGREDLETARRAYEKARVLDPGDVVAMRFLGELHRHHTGDWDVAREIFEAILERPSDRLSRAVALHGLGKMAIHRGEFQQGVRMFEESIDQYPLALTYRNLAVFWNSEDNRDKAYGYVRKALDLEPDEPYNQIFAATYLVEIGREEEAIAIAERYHEVLAASYNLAAIYAQLGERQKAFDYLRRHFYEYEQFDAVRAKEMTEARDDIVFARYHQDPAFVELTSLADSDRSSYHPAATGGM